MKLFLCLASLAISVGMTCAGRPSAGYLPPNYAPVGAAGSSQYPRYHGVSSVGGGHRAAAAPLLSHSAGGGARYGHNSAAAQIPILRNSYNNDGSGHYDFGFETGNGIKRDENGHLQGGWPHGSLNVQGSYSYTGDDGKVYSVNYKADSNGFRAEGDHLPTPPPIPREIQETLHLHQHSAAGPSASYGARHHASPGHHGAPGHFAAASHQVSAHAPSNKYLPPQRH